MARAGAAGGSWGQAKGQRAWQLCPVGDRGIVTGTASGLGGTRVVVDWLTRATRRG